MSKVKALLLSSFAMLALGACATSTPYSAAVDSRYGFAETQIESNRFTVSFSGNSLTDVQTVESYLLFRAAELTRNNGYDYFVMVDRKLDEDTTLRSTGFNNHFGAFGGFHPRFRYSYFHPRIGWGHYRDPFFNDVTLREVTRYEAIAEIVMGRGTKPSGEYNAYDAGDVLTRLATSIRRPEQL